MPIDGPIEVNIAATDHWNITCFYLHNPSRTLFQTLYPPPCSTCPTQTQNWWSNSVGMIQTQTFARCRFLTRRRVLTWTITDSSSTASCSSCRWCLFFAFDLRMNRFMTMTRHAAWLSFSLARGIVNDPDDTFSVSKLQMWIFLSPILAIIKELYTLL